MNSFGVIIVVIINYMATCYSVEILATSSRWKLSSMIWAGYYSIW